MTDKQLILDTLRRMGASIAADLQSRAPELTGTELYAEADYIPGFQAAMARMNMLRRPAGFVCRSTAGRMVRLLQPYDSTIYTQEPEDLPAQWCFAWSTDPAHALPFIALATSPYNTGECCTYDGKTYRSKSDGNVHAPSAWPDGWEEV